jgi:hypothetical protein
MKKWLPRIALMLGNFVIGLSVVLPAGMLRELSADLGVSISVGQPGFYGQINIGGMPQPPLVVAQRPIIVQAPPAGVAMAPVYLRVPPGHQKHWEHRCAEYHACNRPVHFVREDWYEKHYAEHREANRHDEMRREERHDKGQGKGRDRGDD